MCQAKVPEIATDSQPENTFGWLRDLPTSGCYVSTHDISKFFMNNFNAMQYSASTFWPFPDAAIIPLSYVGHMVIS